MTRGGLKYVPREVLEELNRIKIDFKIDKDADGLKKLAENSRIGREIRFTIDFNNRRKR